MVRKIVQTGIFLIVLGLSVTVRADSWEYAGEDEELKYNPFSEKWEYAKEDESLRYNPFSEEWQYAGENEELKYNPWEEK